MNTLSALSSGERQEQIQRMLREQGRITIDQICEGFSVSEATARRDLIALAANGEIRRFHGGAVAIRRAPPEPPILLRAEDQAECKQRIGKLAAGLVTPGETIFLGSGTTVLEVARQLRGSEGITVITNSVLVVNTLSNSPDIMLIGLGGIFRRSEMAFIGHFAEEALRELRPDKVIMGIRGIDLIEGLTSNYLPETTTVRASIAAGKEVIVVADAVKCGRVSTSFVAPISVADTLITDDGISEELADAFAAQGVRVLTA